MRSSMFSPSKKLHKELMLEVSELLSFFHRRFETKAVEQCVATYQQLEAELQTKNFEAEDKKIEAFDKIFK